MKKTTLLFIALLGLGSLNTFAGTNENNKAQFQFTAVNMTQNSWDYASLNYNVNDLNTGESLEIPSFLINYEVKDKAGNIVSNGSGLYLNVNDAKLGSEEDYTVVVSTMINGQRVSQAICRKASPKKFAMKVNAADLDKDNLAYTFTRPKFNNRNETENIQISPSDVSLNIALNNTAYKIDAGKNHTNLNDQPGYQALKSNLKDLRKEGKTAEMTIEPTLVFKGEVYTDNQSYYEVTAKGITEVPSLDAVASK
jgi:hypothetical protein